MADQQTMIEVNTSLKEPPLYNVIYMNDDQTSMQFVIESLVEYFRYTETIAEQIAETVHTAGSAKVATLPYEVAEQKGIEVTFAARKNGYPLQIRLEKDAV